ncbi:hypothetical protein DP188_21720, partial [Enterobacter hormaechei subsp. steigerwaltii]
EMAQLRVQRLHYEDLLNKQPQIRQIRQADGQPLTGEQSRILEAQLRHLRIKLLRFWHLWQTSHLRA